ncbi:MAG: hypothetical protein AAGA20_16080 [Planctomycetota bacterium]
MAAIAAQALNATLRGRRARRRSGAVLSALVLLPALGLAQDEGMEEFDEVDPYTEGDPKKLGRLGYVRVGSFVWEGAERTEHVQETLGGLDVLWVETEHFRIGSSLGTYAIPADRAEKKKLKEELDRFGDKLGRFKRPKRRLDPWIRIHLLALLSEELYDSYVADFGLEEEDGEPNAMGHPQKFNLLVCQRKSELGRYLRAYEQGANDFAYRTGHHGKSMFFGINAEAIAEGYDGDPSQPYDTMLHALVAQGLARNFADGHLQKLFECPEWFSMGLGHVYVRRIDERFVQTGATSRSTDDEHWKWDERVGNLVKNEFFAKMTDMIRWERGREWNEREHMVAWSKVECVIERLDGSGAMFLAGLVTPVADQPAGTPDELLLRQARAFDTQLDLTPDAFDGEWMDWVRDR